MPNGVSQVDEATSERRAKVLVLLLGGGFLTFPLAGIVVAIFVAIYFAIQIITNATIGRAVADFCLLVLCALIYVAGQALWLAKLDFYVTLCLTFAISCMVLGLMPWRTSAYSR